MSAGKFEWVIEVVGRYTNGSSSVVSLPPTEVRVYSDDEIAARSKALALMNHVPILGYSQVWIDPIVTVLSVEEQRE